MKIEIEVGRELSKEEEYRLFSYIYFHLIQDPALSKFIIKSKNFTKEVKP